MGRYKELNSPYSNAESIRPKPVSDNVVPKAPKWLSEEARKIYKQAASDIVRLGIAGKCDANILSVYAMQMARLIEVSQIIEKDLPTNRMLNDLTASTLSLAKEIGLSPSARAKMRLAKVEEDNPIEDLFADDGEK